MLPSMSIDVSRDILIQLIEYSNLAHTISRVDGDRELTYVNQAFLDGTGYARDDVIGRNCRFLQGDGTDQETVKTIRHALDHQKPLDVEILNYKKDGTPFWNRLRMAPVYDGNNMLAAFIGIQADVTDIREHQRLDQERQKLEALGRMTGNISHEIKNALQPVKLMSDVLNDWASMDGADIAQCVEILTDNVAVADRITQDVLRFSRTAGTELEKIDTDVLKDDVVRFVQNLLHSRVEFVQSLDEPPNGQDLTVNICLSHLYQILMNLVNNALYAMKDRGRLTLRWRYATLDPIAALELAVSNGPFLCIAIEDTGGGMDEKTMRSAFDPFFSTKPPGEGTGLGLSISNRIIKKWGGAIKVESKINAGTTFTLYVPITRG